jgi:hypothetical protein
MAFIGSSAARNMANTLWGKRGTKASRTNRNGVYYFSCSGHGGFIIDGRALSPQERDDIKKYITPEKTSVYMDTDGKVRRVRNPFTTRSRTVKTYTGWTKEEVEIFVAEEDADWCVPTLFANIQTDGDCTSQALMCFKRTFDFPTEELDRITAMLNDAGREAA